MEERVWTKHYFSVHMTTTIIEDVISTTVIVYRRNGLWWGHRLADWKFQKKTKNRQFKIVKIKRTPCTLKRFYVFKAKIWTSKLTLIKIPPSYFLNHDNAIKRQFDFPSSPLNKIKFSNLRRKSGKNNIFGFKLSK